MRTRILGVLTSALVLALAPAAPALAWMQHTTSGTPGYVTPRDSTGAQGGVCGDPYESVDSSACSSQWDQVFVARYRAYTSTSYTGPQNITSVAHLYWWDGSAWRLYLNYSEGTCYNRTGSGYGYCDFGSPSSNLEPACSTNRFLCTPAFIRLPPRYYYTVSVDVTWRSSSTGGVLAQANYHPTGVSSDINCAPFARDTLRRCSGPLGGSTGYLWLS